MPNLNPREARTYDPAPTLWKYDPQTNTLWLKLTDAGRLPRAIPSLASRAEDAAQSC